VSENYSIRDLSIEFDVTPRTLRFYEDKGLLSPERRGTQRLYSRRDKTRLSLILRGKRLGFSLADIRNWLELYDLDNGQVAQARMLVETSRERVDALKQQKKDIDRILTDLQEQMQVVENWLQEQQAEAAE